MARGVHPKNEGNHARELQRALRWCEEWLATALSVFREECGVANPIS